MKETEMGRTYITYGEMTNTYNISNENLTGRDKV
jgi:hypothetical protein